MPFQAMCPQCRKTLRLADETRGKKVRCSSCQEIFVAGAATPGAGAASVKPARPAAGPAAKPRADAPADITRSKPKPARRPADDEDDYPTPPKKKKSILPVVLIGCGALVLVCGGGVSIAGFLIYRGVNKAANAVQQEYTAKAKEFEEANKLGQQMQKEADDNFKKAVEEQQQIIKEQQRQIDEAQKRAQEQLDKHKNKGFPLDNLGKEQLPPVKAPDQPQPPARKGEVVQAVGQSIPLDVPPLQVFAVLFPATQKDQVVVVVKPDATKQDVHLDRFDLATGRKMDGMSMPFDFGTSVRDVSPDCGYYVNNHAGTPFSIHVWPNPTPVVSKWLPKPPVATPQGFSNTVVAAYLLPGGKLLTVNGGGQVVRWAIPAAPGGQPAQEASYVPPQTVAKYTLGLGYGLTATSPDRKRLAVYNGSDGYFVLDTDTLQLAAQLRSPEDTRPMENAILGVLGAAFSPDGNHLAGMFYQQRPGSRPPKTKGKTSAAPGGPTLVRWDLQTQQVVARISDPSAGLAGTSGRIGWWGMDHCWVTYPSAHAKLFSWEKKTVVLRDTLRPGSRIFPDSPDGKCWFMVNGPDNKVLLKSVDLPTEALKNAEQPLLLKADGITSR
jgi:LSD1 subclass zinc finger protein